MRVSFPFISTRGVLQVQFRVLRDAPDDVIDTLQRINEARMETALKPDVFERAHSWFQAHPNYLGPIEHFTDGDLLMFDDLERSIPELLLHNVLCAECLVRGYGENTTVLPQVIRARHTHAHYEFLTAQERAGILFAARSLGLSEAVTAQIREHPEPHFWTVFTLTEVDEEHPAYQKKLRTRLEVTDE